MLKKLAQGMPLPSWIKESSRFYRLTLLNKLLFNEYFDHLAAAFYDEVSGIGDNAQLIPLINRRPSAPYNFIQMFAKESARKLFSGRHFPLIRSENIQLDALLPKIVSQGNLPLKMTQAAYFGSIGSVAVTIKVSPEGAIKLEVWRSDWCSPVFDTYGRLKRLRVHYLARGSDILESLRMSLDPEGVPLLDLVMRQETVIEPAETYWTVFDITAEETLYYLPILQDDWNPIAPEKPLQPLYSLENPGGIFPAVWIVNMGSVNGSEGECSWENASELYVEIAYTLSQIGRAVRYNAAPQLVIKGSLEDGDDGGDSLVRSPVTTIYVAAGKKSEEGGSEEGGDAKLLEMTGHGISVGLDYIDKLRKWALETISAGRKDLEQMHGPMSGRAMEMIDQEALDVIYEMRTAYGDNGLLSIIQIILRLYRFYQLVEFPDEDLDQLLLDWPKPYLATAGEAAQLGQAINSFLETGVMDNEELKNYLHGYLDLSTMLSEGFVKSGPATGEEGTPQTDSASAEGTAERSAFQTGPDAADAGQRIVNDEPLDELRNATRRKQRKVAVRQYRAKPDRWAKR